MADQKVGSGRIKWYGKMSPSLFQKVRWEPDNHSVKFEIDKRMCVWPSCFSKWHQFQKQPSVGSVQPR